MRYIVMLAVGLIAVIVGGGLFGVSTWNDSRTFVDSDDAEVVADLVKVGSLNAGQIIALNVDVGTTVLEGQVIATVDIPTVVSASAVTDTAKIGLLDVRDQLADVVAPRSGIIAARWVKEGDTVPTGQPVVTLMDPRHVWVEADIEEDDIKKVRLGQPVEIDIDSLGYKIMGRVELMSPVTSSTLRPPAAPSGPARGQDERVVPIKIALDAGHPTLIPGSTAEIKIRVR
jgi:multidrug resistance efflux pump